MEEDMSLIQQSLTMLQTLSPEEQQQIGVIVNGGYEFLRLMNFYRCAIMEVETKFNVLNTDLSSQFGRNPIESISTRLKEPMSILDKLSRLGKPMTVASIEENLSDVAGVRVICSFISDIYRLSEMLARQDDITVIKLKDYIKHPKDSGYRSLHMVVEVPIFLCSQKRMMRVEIQFRTIAMDFWASLEHKVRYKSAGKNGVATHSPADVLFAASNPPPKIPQPVLDDLSRRLRQCADLTAALDNEMQSIAEEASKYSQ